MIIEIKKNNRTFQAYKEIGILRNVIIEIVELKKTINPFNNNHVFTDHKYITSKGTKLNYNDTNENNIELIKLSCQMIEDLNTDN